MSLPTRGAWIEMNHGQDNKSIFMRLKRVTKHICYIPYHYCLFSNICTNYIYFIIHHFVSTDYFASRDPGLSFAQTH